MFVCWTDGGGGETGIKSLQLNRTLPWQCEDVRYERCVPWKIFFPTNRVSEIGCTGMEINNSTLEELSEL